MSVRTIGNPTPNSVGRAGVGTGQNRLPYGVGSWGGELIALVVVLGAVALAGLGAFIYQSIEGLGVTGLRDWGTMRGSPWGVYIAFDVYFVGVSFAGITMAALVRLFNLEKLKPVARIAEILTIVSLILAGLSVLADLGQPVRGVINLFKYARPQSPFFGTFTLVISGYLFASIVYFYLSGRRDAYLMAQHESRLRSFYKLWAAGYTDTPEQRARHARISLLLSLAIIPLLVTAHSTLGLVFGLMSGRPGWFSALQAPAFVVLAGISGVGHLIVIAAILRYTLQESEQIDIETFKILGMFLLVLGITYLYFTVLEVLTSGYAGHEKEWDVVRLLLTGTYAPMFWLSTGALVAAVLLLAYQAITAKWKVSLLVASGLLVNITAIGKRLLIVTPSLTHGSLLPYPSGAYRPSWVELTILAGLLSLGALLIVGFVKVFPAVELAEGSGEGGKEEASDD